MYCPKCGKENREQARFCRYCGTLLKEQEESRGAIEESGSQEDQPIKRTRKKKWIILAAALAAAAAAALVFLWILPQHREKRYNGYISDGDRYLEKMDYEKAEDSYLAAIEIERKEPEPYLKLADIYSVQNEPEKAAEILKRGVENTGDPAIQQQYDLYTYVQEVLIPEEGRCEEGEYICKYISQPWADSAWVGLEPIHSVKGILTLRIRDYDSDGTDELLVFSMKNDAREYSYTRVDQNEVILRMYEPRDGEIVLSDERTVLCPVLGDGDSETSGLFLHENDGQIYICGSLRQHTYVTGDGAKINSFVLIYEGENFVKLAGTDQTVMGSEFSAEASAAKEMADFLEDIGLPEEAAQIKKSWMRCFQFIDDVEMLMLITGENTGMNRGLSYSNSIDPEELGEVVLTLKLTWNEETDEAESAETDEGQEIQKLAESAEEAYRSILDKQEYRGYTAEWLEEPESYSIIDINQDQVPELMVHSANSLGWANTLLFVYDSADQTAKMIEDIYHYSEIRYSEVYNAIVYTDIRPAEMYGGYGFTKLENAALKDEFFVGWDGTSGERQYYIFQGESQKGITEEEKDAYYAELTEIERTAL